MRAPLALLQLVIITAAVAAGFAWASISEPTTSPCLTPAAQGQVIEIPGGTARCD